MKHLIIISGLLFGLHTVAAQADVIFEEDFQSGTYNDWTLSGNGSDTINYYAGNASLRLDGLRQGYIELNTQGYSNVSLSMDLAGLYLVNGDFCHAEYSINAGQTWSPVVTLGHTQATGNFVTGSVSSGLDNQANLRLRFRAYTLFNHFCYGDNIVLTGDPNSQGDTIATEDFQSGSYSAWSLAGDGNDQINLFAGNYSLRLDGLRQATLNLSSAGYENVQLSMDVAALYLVTGDFCHAEYSTNGGQSWQSLLSIGNGQDDGQFRTGTASGLDDNSQLQVRFRAYTLYGHYCYGDNVLLSGAAIDGGGGQPAIQLTGSGNFPDTEIGSQSSQSFVLSNSGSELLTISNLSTNLAVFNIDNDTCSAQDLVPTAQCTFSVAFTPDSPQLYNGNLTVTSNAPSSPDMVNLSGIGVTEQGEPGCDLDCLPGDGQVNRSQLTYNQLMATAQGQLVNYSNYGLPTNAANPTNTFSGSLSLSITPGVFSEQGTNLASAYTNPDSLPAFDFEFVQKGTHLIPVQRQVIATSHPAWDYILLPGRVWQESGDQGYSRVALPFALQEINANCIHNGVMTFLFKDDGSVSNVAYQIAQETCQYFKFNLHGKLSANYQPAAVSNASAITQDYLQELAARIPSKSLAELVNDYPAAGVNLSAIGADQTNSHRTAHGVYYQGVHYRGECATRQGNYPYCEVIALPSYSTAKSVVAGYGLMAMEQQYGGSARALKISDYVSQCPSSRWGDVTFEHALDMATGNYDSAGDSVDEGSQKTINEFFLTATHNDKINHACAYARKSTPGSLFVYHSSDTYILSAGLQAFYRQQAGSQADYYRDFLVEELWQPLQLSPLSYESRRSLDSVALPWAGFGLSLLSDDLLKLARFASIDGGTIGQTQWLHPTMLDDALQRGNNPGLTAGGSSSRYRLGFWAFDLGASAVINCPSQSWVPYMSGFGGIGVVLLPNDMIYYYVSDNNEYGFTQTVNELHKISPVCQ